MVDKRETKIPAIVKIRVVMDTNEVLVYPESGVGNECPVEIIGRSDDLSAV